MAAVLVTGKPVSSALRWNAADPVIFHLLNRLGLLIISETSVVLVHNMRASARLAECKFMVDRESMSMNLHHC